MSATTKPTARRLPRLVAAGVTLLVALLVAVLGAAIATLAVATPAGAADGDVKVTLSGLGSSIVAGGRDDFTVRTENKTDQMITGIRHVIVVQMEGLNPDQVTVSRRSGLPLQKSSPGQGEIRFAETLPYPLAPNGTRGDNTSANFTIRFDQSVLPGEATVTAYAMRDAVLGSASDSMVVKASRSSGKTSSAPTSLPPVTLPPVTPAATNGAPAPTVEGPANSNLLNNSSPVPPILYVLGGVLVVLGGVILWLLFRAPKAALADGYGTADYEPAGPGGLGYPTPPRHASGAVAPTTVMPAARDPRIPGPGVDPWAHVEPTDEFPRRH